jgi:hypothetical protein
MPRASIPLVGSVLAMVSGFGVLTAAVALIALPTANATQLQPPYVCKEWTAKFSWDGYEHDSPPILFQWVNGWLEGYRAAHPEADLVLPGQLYTFLDKFCYQYPGELLINALMHADFVVLEEDARKRVEWIDKHWGNSGDSGPTANGQARR